MSTGKVVLGIIAAATAGALMGVLFAPDKGSETRRKISKKGSETLDELKVKFDDMVKNFTHKFDKANGEAGKLIEKGKQSAEEVLKDPKNSMG